MQIMLSRKRKKEVNASNDADLTNFMFSLTVIAKDVDHLINFVVRETSYI